MKTKTLLTVIVLTSATLLFASPQLPFMAYFDNSMPERDKPVSWDAGDIIWAYTFNGGTTYYLYYSSSLGLWSLPGSIGLAISADGYEFNKLEGSVLETDGTRPDTWSFSCPEVIKDDGSAALCIVNKIATGLEKFYLRSTPYLWNIGFATSENRIMWYKSIDNAVYSCKDDPIAVSNGYYISPNPTIKVEENKCFMYYDYSLMRPGSFSFATNVSLAEMFNVSGDQRIIKAALNIVTHGNIVLVAEGKTSTAKAKSLL